MSDQILQLLPNIMPRAYFGSMADEMLSKPVTQTYKMVKTSRAWAEKQLHKITGVSGREGIYHETILKEMKELPDLLPEILDYESIITHADKFFKLVGKNAKGNNLIAQKIKAKGYIVTKIEPEPIEVAPPTIESFSTIPAPVPMPQTDSALIHIKRNLEAGGANTYCGLTSKKALIVFGDRLSTTCPDCETSYDPEYKIVNKHPVIRKIKIKVLTPKLPKPVKIKHYHSHIIKTHRILRSIKWLSEYLFSVKI